MKLIVSGGGTGGHVYPALTVLEMLLRRDEPVEGLPSLAPRDLLWIGSRGGMEEELVRRAGIEFVGLPAGGLRSAAVPLPLCCFPTERPSPPVRMDAPCFLRGRAAQPRSRSSSVGSS